MPSKEVGQFTAGPPPCVDDEHWARQVAMAAEIITPVAMSWLCKHGGQCFTNQPLALPIFADGSFCHPCYEARSIERRRRLALKEAQERFSPIGGPASSSRGL